MHPTQVGRHCNSCKKEVIDFTLMTDDEVKNYLLNNIGKETCGRFFNHQVDSIKIVLPENILQTRIAKWKKFVVVLMICFGVQLFSIEVSLGQKIDTTIQKVDTLKDDVIMGDGVLDTFDIEKKVDSIKTETLKIEVSDVDFITGNISPTAVHLDTTFMLGFTTSVPIEREKEYIITMGDINVCPHSPYVDNLLSPKPRKKKEKIPNKKLPLSNPSFLPEEFFTLNRKKKSK